MTCIVIQDGRRRGFCCAGQKWAVGDQPPAGYVDWHEWAGVQQRGGLCQSRCRRCGLYGFPQEMATHRCEP